MAESDSALRTADRVGFAASVLCAIHCALLPLALAAVPVLGLKLGGVIDLDQAFVVFATVLGVTTLSFGYRRHRAFRAWAFLVPGIVLVWAGAFGPLHAHGVTHTLLMTVGGLALAAAHVVNLRLSHRPAA
ncbi:MerC domain-containing protein [Lysobacter humi (ex Lee et al. 2017)]